jgi:nitrate reductase NapE component
MPAEIAPTNGRPNRLFIVLAVGLVGLLVLGVIGIGGFVLLQNVMRPAAAPTVRAAAVTTPTRVPLSPTPAATATPAPTEAATPTLVLTGGAGGTPTPLGTPGTVTPTSTGGVTGTPGTGQLPKSGLGEDLLVLVGGVVLVLIVFAARRARTSGTA